MSEADSILGVSVIVPIFNPPLDRLERCLASIAKQQPVVDELILINDGSDSETTVYLESYSREKEGVVVINQENKGASAARNTGVLFARAPYIMFVDGDDELEEGALRQALDVAREGNYDVVLGFSQKYHENGQPYCPIPDQELNGKVCPLDPDDLVRYALTGRTGNRDLCVRHDVLDVISGGPVARLIKRSIATKTPFPEGIVVCEDTIWNVKLFQACASAAVVKSCWYRYYQLRDSSIHRYRANSDVIAYESISALKETLNAEASTKYAREIECRFLGELNRVAKNYLLQECDLPTGEKRRRIRRTYERVYADSSYRNRITGKKGVVLSIKKALCRSGLNLDAFYLKNKLELVLQKIRGFGQ